MLQLIAHYLDKRIDLLTITLNESCMQMLHLNKIAMPTKILV